MNRLLLCLLVACGLVGIMTVAPTRAGDDEAKKKIEQIRKELDELTKKEKDLAKQRDDVIKKEKDLAKQREELQKAIADVQREVQRRAEEQRIQKEVAQRKFDEADKKRHYAKIELRGKLISSKTIQPYHPFESWFVLANETLWPLQMDKKNELQQSATKLSGQPVIVTGAISTQRRNPQIFPVLPIEDQISPFPRPTRLPQAYPGVLSLQDVQLPVVVESIRLFEEK